LSIVIRERNNQREMEQIEVWKRVGGDREAMS
jgi:hypothetical protein